MASFTITSAFNKNFIHSFIGHGKQYLNGRRRESNSTAVKLLPLKKRLLVRRASITQEFIFKEFL